MEVEDFFLGRPALRFPILFCFPCFLLFLFFFFFLFTNAALFHSFYHLVRQCTVSVWYWPHSADRCLYTIVKPPKHVARTPLSANPPTIHALPRSPALGYFFPSSILPPSLHHQSPPPPPPSRPLSLFPPPACCFSSAAPCPSPPGSTVVQDFATHS